MSEDTVSYSHCPECGQEIVGGEMLCGHKLSFSRTTQVFLETVRLPMALPAAGCPNFENPKMEEFTVRASNPGEMFLSIGPLNPEIFQHGDEVQIIVQRKGKKKHFANKRNKREIV